jgi:hypothetical protein
MTTQSAYSTLSKLRHRLQRALDDRRSRIELQASPASELHRIAQDVGLNDTNLRALSCNHRGPGELMPRRLEQLGLDPAYVRYARTATYRDLERVCATCKAWRRCARDLANGDVETGMRNYCLNAPTIDALIVERPGTPKH